MFLTNCCESGVCCAETLGDVSETWRGCGSQTRPSGRFGSHEVLVTARGERRGDGTAAEMGLEAHQANRNNIILSELRCRADGKPTVSKLTATIKSTTLLP